MQSETGAPSSEPEVAVAADPPVVRYEVQDRIATVTLNRPGARNALSRALTRALWASSAAHRHRHTSIVGNRRRIKFSV